MKKSRNRTARSRSPGHTDCVASLGRERAFTETLRKLYGLILRFEMQDAVYGLHGEQRETRVRALGSMRRTIIGKRIMEERSDARINVRLADRETDVAI